MNGLCHKADFVQTQSEFWVRSFIEFIDPIRNMSTIVCAFIESNPPDRLICLKSKQIRSAQVYRDTCNSDLCIIACTFWSIWRCCCCNNYTGGQTHSVCSNLEATSTTALDVLGNSPDYLGPRLLQPEEVEAKNWDLGLYDANNFNKNCYGKFDLVWFGKQKTFCFKLARGRGTVWRCALMLAVAVSTLQWPSQLI